MTDCCELLKTALYVIAGAFGVILTLLAMFFGYNLSLDRRTVKLEKKNGKELKRIEELEKKNGSEQHQIDKLFSEVNRLKTKLKDKSNPEKPN